MKNLHIPILFLSIMLIAVSCENQKFNDQKIIISGQIKDYRKNNSQKTIAFNFQTLENIKSDIKVAIINSAGDFKVETSIAWPQDFFFEYGGKRFYFICSPGDSLKVSIDNAIWGKKDNDKLSCLTIVGGSARDDNAYVNIFIQRIEKILSQYSSPHIVKAYEARDYKEFVLSKKEEAHRDFKNLLDSLRTTSLFNKWAASYINYKSYNYLLRYHIWHPAYNGIDRTEFSMPDEFYSFLNEINIDDKEVISTYQEGFYHEFSLYLDELLPRDSLERHWQLFESDVIEYFSNSVKQRANKSSGFTSDIIVFEIYSRMLDWSLISEMETIYQPDIFNYKYFANKLETKLIEIKKHIDNPIFTDNISHFHNNDITEGLIDTIISKYQGNVMYIGFWSPSCGPCLKEFPFAKQLHNDYQDEDIVFLYLASSCKEDSWKAKISEKQLSGEHFLLSNDQFSLLSQRFDISGIPHYVLIDRKGNVISKNASRPSSNEIRMEIDKLFNY